MTQNNNARSAEDSTPQPASVEIFDRLPNPVGGLAHRRPKASLYHTRRAEKQRQNVDRIPQKYMDEALEILMENTPVGGWKSTDVAAHNRMTLAAALAYADLGLFTIDSHALDPRTGTGTGPNGGEKIPRGAGWQERASTDRDAVIKFWLADGQYPANKKGKIRKFDSIHAPRNVSIAFPDGCGLFVLDIDGEAGFKSLDKLEEEYGALPQTWESITGSGGVHLVFTAEGLDIRNTASAIASGVDIRGHNGQILAAPSIHKTGNFYTWEEGSAPWECEVADAPEWLVNLAIEASKKTQSKPKAATSDDQDNPFLQAGLGGAAESVSFEGVLTTIGHGAAGFNSPIFSAICKHVRRYGEDTDREELKEALRTAIAAAPCDDDSAETRYMTDAYLDEQIDEAFEWYRGLEDLTPDQTDTATDTSDAFEATKVWLPKRYKVSNGNIWTKAGDEDEESAVPICVAFDVVGRSSNEDGTAGAGRIISFVNENGKIVERTISRADIAVDGNAVIRDLADCGLLIFGRGKKATERLLDLLNEITPTRQIPIVNTPGWVRDEFGDLAGFMHPTGVYDRVSGPPCRLLEGSQVEVVKPKGTLTAWTTVAVEALSYADTNFYWPLGLVSGFAGPLLGILDWLPSGFSLSGRTSKGKTMAQIMGTTVWTTPAAGRGVLFTANTTGNAMEDLAVRATGTFLGVDELGAMSDKRALGGMTFALSTGRTKSRKMGRERGLTEGDSFGPFVVFSSEKGMRNEIEAAGGDYRGGLAVRFPEIDVSEGVNVTQDRLAKLDAFKGNYGHAGPAYIRYLIESGIISDPAKLENEVTAIASGLAGARGAAMSRAARVFALAQRGGELAAGAGLLGDTDAAKAAIRTTIQTAWDTFVDSDEAGAASSGDALQGDIVSKLNGMWDRTIIEAGGVSKDGQSLGEADGKDARGTPMGWYDPTYVYLDWAQIADPAKSLGVTITRAELVKVMGDAVERKSVREAPQAKLPSHVAQAANGDGRSVKNLKLRRDKLGL